MFWLLLLLLQILLIKTQQEVGCIIWKNSFVKITKYSSSTSQDVFEFTVQSVQREGYMSLGFFSQPSKFDDSFAVIGYKSNKLIQVENHTTIVQRPTFFGGAFQHQLFDSVDGTMTFTFSLNSSDLQNKKYFAFSQTTKEKIINTPVRSFFMRLIN